MGINPHLTQGLDRFTDHDPANTVYVEAGVITFGLEYRFSYQKGSDGHLTDEVKDHGISIHIFEGPGSQGRELLRFDCFQIRPHYHYANWSLEKHQLTWFDTAAWGDFFQWAIERLKTRLPHMLMAAGAEQLAAQVDQRAVDAVLPKVVVWAEALTERALVNWHGRLYLTGAGNSPALASAQGAR